MAAHAATLPHCHVPENGAVCFLPPNKGWYAGHSVKFIKRALFIAPTGTRAAYTYSSGIKAQDGRSLFILRRYVSIILKCLKYNNFTCTLSHFFFFLLA